MIHSHSRSRSRSREKQLRPQETCQHNLQQIKKVFMDGRPNTNPEDVRKYRQTNRIFIKSAHTFVPDPILRFEDVYCFPRPLQELIVKAGFPAPTPIQAQSWSIGLTGHDLIGIAQTGSGKTLAFLLPAIIHILAQLKQNSDPQCLIMAPTRELTNQIYEQFTKFSVGSGLKAACLFGGQEKFIQKNQLNQHPHILIACPGRLIDLVESGSTTLKGITFLVLDEADRMLDMGFEPSIRKIVAQTRAERQTMLFSATWPREVQSLALDFCTQQPIHIQIGSLDLTSNRQIQQKVIILNKEQKEEKLREILKQLGSRKILIFCQTKLKCDQLQLYLIQEGMRCKSLHGDKRQSERDFVMNSFKRGDTTVLVATDVASRGLDIKDIEFVINFDMPKLIEDYVHRIGRTGRAGAQGVSISLFDSYEDAKLAGDLVGVLRESQNEVPNELSRLANVNNQGYQNYRKWNAPSGKIQYCT
ncbi:unnamed protein product [Paramecium primaurelia]|uniref:RNA helicase n=1 Tax=Paramecium primaurelia TaxID=5886 RepID=A0A8S1N5Q7_PARPR|nr:unnamed protein product [Paramecium primaurelia]